MDETSRIKEAYAKRNIANKSKLYSYLNPSALLMYQEREKAILRALDLNGFQNMSDKRILDLGCGTGPTLRDFVKYGAYPENCYGIDLLPDRIEEAKRISPNMHFRCGNAENLSFDNEYFNIVLSSTVFTSIFDKNMKQNIAREMIRVLKPTGLILWYDYHMDNPKNPDVRGVKKKEIHELFPDCDIKLERITLAPPLTRAIAPHSFLLCYLLEKIKILNTHYLGTIRKPD